MAQLWCCHNIMIIISCVDVKIGLEMARLIQQSRMKAKMTQKELASVSNDFCWQVFLL